MQDEWQGKIAVLEAREAARREQLRRIAHDLASPLTPMRLQLSLWKDKGVDEAGLQRLERSIERMMRMVEDVADLAFSDNEGLRMQKRPVDLAGVVDEAVQTFFSRAVAKDITLHAAISGTLTADVDRERIMQVLDNLLRNALKFTPAGGTVAVEARADGEGIRLSVSDSGRGLSPADLGLLFQAYSQVEASDASIGTGLGLFICQQIAEAHGGHMTVQSDGRGKGSRFTLTLPAQVPMGRHAADSNTPPIRGRGGGNLPPGSGLQPIQQGRRRRRRFGGTQRCAPYCAKSRGKIPRSRVRALPLSKRNRASGK